MSITYTLYYIHVYIMYNLLILCVVPIPTTSTWHFLIRIIDNLRIVILSIFSSIIVYHDFVFLKLFFTVTIPFIFLNLFLMDVCLSILLRLTMDRFMIHVLYITQFLVSCRVVLDEYLRSFRVSRDSKSWLKRLNLIDSRFQKDLLIQVNNLQVFDKNVCIYCICIRFNRHSLLCIKIFFVNKIS